MTVSYDLLIWKKYRELLYHDILASFKRMWKIWFFFPGFFFNGFRGQPLFPHLAKCLFGMFFWILLQSLNFTNHFACRTFSELVGKCFFPEGRADKRVAYRLLDWTLPRSCTASDTCREEYYSYDYNERHHWKSSAAWRLHISHMEKLCATFFRFSYTFRLCYVRNVTLLFFKDFLLLC